MAQSSDFPLRKPPGFHWDFFLLGVTTFLAGLIGVPAPNGLIPQAPIHTKSLLVMSHRSKKRMDEEELAVRPSTPDHISNSTWSPPDSDQTFPQEYPVAVVEQRVSNLAQGALCLVLLTGPFLHLLNLIPRGDIRLLNQHMCHP